MAHEATCLSAREVTGATVTQVHQNILSLRHISWTSSMTLHVLRSVFEAIWRN